MSSSKKISLISSDGETFQVEEALAVQAQTIKYLIEYSCFDSGIPLPNVSGSILSKIIEYWKKHFEAAAIKDSGMYYDVDSLESWDAEFVKVDRDTLFDLTLAANFLNMKSLLDLTCQTVVDMTEGKTPEEIRKFFKVENEDEEEAVRKKNAWAYDQ